MWFAFSHDSCSLLQLRGYIPRSTDSGHRNHSRHRRGCHPGSASSGAHITVHNDLTGETRAVDSTAAGRFSVAGLPVTGEYSVSATHAGFAEAGAASRHARRGFKRASASHASRRRRSLDCDVEGVALDVRVDQPQLGILITGQKAADVPLPARRITYLPLLDSANEPAINQGDIFMNEHLFTTNGAGRRQALFVADGANAIDMWGRQPSSPTSR